MSRWIASAFSPIRLGANRIADAIQCSQLSRCWVRGHLKLLVQIHEARMQLSCEVSLVACPAPPQYRPCVRENPTHLGSDPCVAFVVANPIVGDEPARANVTGDYEPIRPMRLDQADSLHRNPASRLPHRPPPPAPRESFTGLNQGVTRGQCRYIS